MNYACVTTNVLDLWATPKYNSERLSQLLFGDIVSLGNRKAGFVRVRELDGYSGWLDERFIARCSKASERIPRGWKQAIVADPSATVYGLDTSRTVSPHLIYYGTKLAVRRHKPGMLLVRLGDGSIFSLRSKSVRLLEKPSTGIKARHILKEAARFLGAPYLWGGITPAGFDCSGLVRSVFRQFNIELPRDTKDQIRAGEKVNRDKIRAGDLLFFDRHVAIAMGKGKFIHASRGGGGVRINSLNRGESDYRADLDRDFQIARRILDTN